jgi:NitT/TauT family transport system ATP-binding protein/sulfonate transport system ATP-binding protein
MRTQQNIALSDVGKIFSVLARGDVEALSKIEINIPAGQIYALVGPSGCGKSTILNLVAGFDKVTSGSVSVGGRAVQKPGPDRGVVFQEHGLFPWLTAIDNVQFGLQVRGIKNSDVIARDHLKLVGLGGFEKHYPRELSGGMRQRVALARVLANEPGVLLMDEPFGALDAQTRFLMQELLLEVWTASKPTVLLITHDVDEAIFVADRVGVMTARPGRIKAEFDVPLSRPRSYKDLVTGSFVSLKQEILEILRAEIIAAGKAVAGDSAPAAS